MTKVRLPNLGPKLEKTSFFTLKDRVRLLKRTAKQRAEKIISEIEHATVNFPFSLNTPFQLAGDAASGLIDVADKILHDLVSFDAKKINEHGVLLVPSNLSANIGKTETEVLGAYYFLLNQLLKKMPVEGYFVSELSIYTAFKNFLKINPNDSMIGEVRTFVKCSDSSFSSALFIYSLLVCMPVRSMKELKLDDEEAIQELRRINMIVCVGAILSAELYELQRTESSEVDILNTIQMGVEISSALEEDLISLVKNKSFHAQLAKKIDLVIRYL